MTDTNIGYWEKVLENPTPAYRGLLDAESKYLLERIAINSFVLDIGCGDGRNMRTILQKTKNVIGVDNDDVAIKDAKESFVGHPEVKVIKADADALPFPDKTFDAVVLFDILQNLNSNKVKVLDEAKRVLKDNGQILLCFYSENAFDERMNMYGIIKVPIERVEGTTVYFDKSVGAYISEQLSERDLKTICDEASLKISDIQKVGKLAYVCTLNKVGM